MAGFKGFPFQALACICVTIYSGQINLYLNQILFIFVYVCCVGLASILMMLRGGYII